MSTQFPKRKHQPLRQDSYLRAARKVRHLAELIEREPVTPRDQATRSRAIRDLYMFAQHFSRKHHIGRGGY